MPMSRDLQTLMSFGILNDAAVSRLAQLIEHIEAIAATTANGTRGGVRHRTVRRARGRRGRPRKYGRGAGRRPGRPANRGRRGAFNPSKDQLQAMRKTMTVAQIAKKTGVSTFTVNARLKSHGLTKRRK